MPNQPVASCVAVDEEPHKLNNLLKAIQAGWLARQGISIVRIVALAMQLVLATAARLLIGGSAVRSQVPQDLTSFDTLLSVADVSSLPGPHHFTLHESTATASRTDNGSSQTSHLLPRYDHELGMSTLRHFSHFLSQNQQSLGASGNRFANAFLKASPAASHKALWPLDSRDWLTFAGAAFAIFIAAGGGIGGGGVLVPLYASLLGMHNCIHMQRHLLPA